MANMVVRLDSEGVTTFLPCSSASRWAACKQRARRGSRNNVGSSGVASDREANSAHTQSGAPMSAATLHHKVVPLRSISLPHSLTPHITTTHLHAYAALCGVLGLHKCCHSQSARQAHHIPLLQQVVAAGGAAALLPLCQLNVELQPAAALAHVALVSGWLAAAGAHLGPAGGKGGQRQQKGNTKPDVS